MKHRDFIVTLVALVAIALASVVALRYQRRRGAMATCPFCGRMVHPADAYRVTMGGRELVACCPRCALHAQVNQNQVKWGEAWATDVNSREKVPAESAVYVEGGDVEYCAHGNEAMTREPNGVSVREYDRCLPNLVAFKTPQEAQAYTQQHGGRVLTYAQALSSVREQ